jgi:glycyl-tRNA synthetase beta chain
MLACFFAIGEKPTGSKDPYALRRAALGIIRIVLERHPKNLNLPSRLLKSADLLVGMITVNERNKVTMAQAASGAVPGTPDARIGEESAVAAALGDLRFGTAFVPTEVMAFLADRLKVLLRDQGKRHDLVDAVFALGDDDLVRIVARVEAIDAFLKTDDGANLLAGYRRATNILKAEEKKGPLPTGDASVREDAPEPELALLGTLRKILPELKIELETERFTDALTTLASLRAPVDAFFEKVLVNAEDVAVRQNRLRLLAQVRDAMGLVADFSLITG